MFVPGKPFQHSLTFVSKARAYLSKEPLRLVTLPTNIRQGWKGLPGTNTLAYSKKFLNYGRKKFNNIDARLNSLPVRSLPVQPRPFSFRRHRRRRGDNSIKRVFRRH